MNLRLLSKLQGADSVHLLLKRIPGDLLEYYLISQSITYSLVCTGRIPGTIDEAMVSFDIRMSSISLLVDKGIKFDIEYLDGDLKFISEDRAITIVPSYVEHNDTNITKVIELCLRFSSALDTRQRVVSQIEENTLQLRQLQANYDSVAVMHLSGGPSSDPFTEDTTMEKIDAEYQPRIAEKKKLLEKLKNEQSLLTELDLSEFLILAYSAARGHNLVDMCGTYGIVSLHNSFLLQKGNCPIQAIQGQLLYQLIRDGNGKNFFAFEDKLVYLTAGKDRTLVFVNKYLPNSTVDSSIVTKGTVEEKYSVKLKNALDVATIVNKNFPKLSLDMGASAFILTNDLGEKITIKFDIEDAKTLQLIKLMRNTAIQGGVTMSEIDIPNEVRGVLGLFKNNLVVYVKKRKVIFQNEGLYLVFGR